MVQKVTMFPEGYYRFAFCVLSVLQGKKDNARFNFTPACFPTSNPQ
jgi:hypothetical protein